MNQLAKNNERPSKPALLAGGAISAIVPQSIEEAFRLAEAIHMSGMAPSGFDSPQKVMIAMLAGLEIGMPPMASVQSVAVINNRPCIWGDALIGVVRKSPLCLYVTEWIEGEGDEMIAHCETHRKGEPRPVKMSFSVVDAKKAGLWQTEARITKKSRDGGTYQKDNDSPWYKYPKRMLQMRARAWCLRDVYADVTKGMQVREEVEDYQHVGPDNARDITPAQPSVMARLRAAQEAPQQPEEEREGFDAAFVHSETETALTGEILPNTNSDDESPAQSSDNAGMTPVDEAGADEVPASDAPASTDPERDILIRFAAEMLPMAATAPTEAWKEVEKGWSEGEMKKLSSAGLEKAKAISMSLRAIAKGNTSLESAVEYYAEVLDCKASDLGGVDG
ncbi:hypothetical protein AGRHK599_LOCUS1254 [Rhizobium rhizogenes]|uniref:Recombinase RecT n=1 Tax=Rhizobium rhizogenes TaxID=359 RepID=A0AAN2A1L8_RHIRH|nr:MULTISPECIES: hypothetical protein [Rhizobium/Agrobacterium group]AQS61743.1 hypothetical protein B0909_05395 [Rhizobium rhizogenes]MCZ7443029.1 hypothetical protein [Rhizobium rhizogenes]NSZ79014.1 hypothetical protein [Agrobacterium tumefaciens]OAM65811.1 hypothetical protein A8L48_22730 [Rhizobium rhizogenes]CAD0211228.1 hypothetical protein AGRHK599_LOCUS1254 [Rhizobium rhizogenes]